MPKYKSCARWESKHHFNDNMTTDIHDTLEAALFVIDELERSGLDGEKIHFPIHTWIERLEEVPTPDGFGYVWVEVED